MEDHPKLSTEQTTQLGADIFIMKLLGIMQQKAMAGVVDFTLKFALSALWNLTHETPTALRNFLQCQGMQLYKEVLEYCRILQEEGAVDLVKTLTSDLDNHSDVRGMAESILGMLERQQTTSDP